MKGNGTHTLGLLKPTTVDRYLSVLPSRFLRRNIFISISIFNQRTFSLGDNTKLFCCYAIDLRNWKYFRYLFQNTVLQYYKIELPLGFVFIAQLGCVEVKDFYIFRMDKTLDVYLETKIIANGCK